MANALRNNTRKRGPKKTNGSKGEGVSPKIIYIILVFFVASTLALLIVLFMNRAAPLDTVQKDIEKLGEVVSRHEVPNSTMTAWYIKVKDTGENALFFTTRDGKTMAGGSLWDTATGEPITADLAAKMISDNPELATGEVAGNSGSAQASPQASASASQPDMTPGQAIGKWDGEVPKVFEVLDTLGGFKEDESVAPEDTIYLLYDPRCPYCTEFLKKSRNIDMKAKGVTIKWLPSVALGVQGEDDPVIAQAAYGLVTTNINDFMKSFGTGGDAMRVDTVSDDQMNALDANLSLLYEAADRTFGEGSPKAVPAAFYMDKRNGTPRMVYGAQEDNILVSIFGE
ncbi:hypothetical protein [Psychrobacter sp. AOP31-A1-22]|uniref:hypothetical protein n=1 Tax=Psychrobacter sp. AOP31-A1-22 TaxID=3457696 RepID=UPI0040358660